MQGNANIIGVYAAFFRPPRRFAIHRQTGPRQESYEIYRPSTIKDFLFTLLDVLVANNSNFLAKLEKVDDSEWQRRGHRTRRYIAKEKDVLYIAHPKLATKYAEEYGQYWLATNIGWKEASAIVRSACKAAGIKCRPLTSVRL